jgi:hypothetical protein
MGAAFTSLPRYRHFLSEQEGPLKKPYMPGDEGWRETVSTFLSSRKRAIQESRTLLDVLVVNLSSLERNVLRIGDVFAS